MSSGDSLIGIDFGTSNTAAVVGLPDGRVRPVLFDGLPQLPSAVFADRLDRLLVGRDALYAARSRPAALEPHPKQRIDEGTVLLDDVPVEVVTLIGAVLRRVAAEAVRSTGAPPTRAVLTCPVAWGQRRRATLRAAAEQVFGKVELVDEPVAAANHFLSVAGDRLPAGAAVVVYDLGAGTFDVAVLRREPDGFTVLATEGLTDAGGLDVDAAIVAHLGATYAGRDPDRWRRLTHPETGPDRRLSHQLWEDVRTGKELLSRSTSTRIPLPLFDDDAPFGREQLDLLARPVLERTISATSLALVCAGVDPAAVAGLFLVGGASRLALAATRLHQRLGIAPTVIEQPELAVAEGSLRAARPLVAPGGAAGSAAVPATAVGSAPPTAQGAAPPTAQGAAPPTAQGSGLPGAPARTSPAGHPGAPPPPAPRWTPTAAPHPRPGAPPAPHPRTGTVPARGRPGSAWAGPAMPPAPAGPARRPWAARRSRQIAVAASALALFAALAIGTVLLSGTGDGEADRGSPSRSVPAAGGTAGSAGPGGVAGPASGQASAPAPVGGDACLVGSWEQVRIEYPNSNYYGTTVTMVGKGSRYHFRADGTGRTEIDITLSGKANGDAYSETHEGVLTWRYRAGDGQILYSDIKTSGTVVIRINGKVRERRDISVGDNSVDTYTCATDSLFITGKTFDQELHRISSTPQA